MDFIESLSDFLTTIDATTLNILSIVSFNYFTVPILIWLFITINWGYELAFYGTTSPKKLAKMGVDTEIKLNFSSIFMLICTTMLAIILALISNGVGYYVLEVTGWSEQWTDDLLRYINLKD